MTDRPTNQATDGRFIRINEEIRHVHICTCVHYTYVDNNLLLKRQIRPNHKIYLKGKKVSIVNRYQGLFTHSIRREVHPNRNSKINSFYEGMLGISISSIYSIILSYYFVV